MSWGEVPFEQLYAIPSKNGLTRPSRVRGSGFKMINMGELFAHDRIGNIEMELVLMNERELENMLVAPGDLLFARQSLVLAGAGKCSIVQAADEPTTFESHLIRVRLNRKLTDPTFYYYYFRSPISRIRSIVTQGVQAGIRATDLARLSVHVPPFDIQRNIAERLQRYDDLIENNRRRIQLLEQSARLLYKEWFVHLRFPGHEHMKVVECVPEGWRRACVPEIIEVNPKETVKKGTDIRYVPMSALSETGMTVDPAEIEIRTKPTSAKFRQGDVLFARITPCLENGKTGFVNFLTEGEVACGSTEFVVLRGRSISPEFTYCLSRSYDFRENAIKSMIGSSGRQRVQTSCFDEFVVPVPPDSLLEQFGEFASRCFEQIRTLITHSHRLKEARDVLLPRLMNGEIAV